MSGRPYGYWVRFGELHDPDALDLRPYISGYSSDLAAATDDVATLYGASGGVQTFGKYDNPKSPATITITLGIRARWNTVKPDPGVYMEERQRIINGLRRGRQRLWYAPRGTYDPQQWLWTWAKCTLIDDKNDIASAMYTSVQTQFSAADPFLYGGRKGSDWYWDGSTTLIGNQYFLVDSANLSVGAEVSVWNAGTAPALPLLTFADNDGTLGGFVFQRITDGIVQESFGYAGTINSTKPLLIVNARSHFISDAVNFAPGMKQQYIMSIPPGQHTLKLASANTLTGTPRLQYSFEHTWHI